MKTLLVFLSACLLARAQAPAQAAQQGISADWDVSKSVAALTLQAQRVKPVLDQLTPQAWVRRGAPPTYVAQWQSAQKELTYTTGAAKAFEQEPERLTLALDTYFRMQALEKELTSLAQGARKYQNPALGDQLISVLAQDSSNRDQLRQYITDLAAQKEQVFGIVDKEAQRCRNALSEQPPAPVRKASKTERKQ